MRAFVQMIGLAALLGTATLAPAFAKTTQYECKFAQEGRGGGWIPEIAYITVDDAAGTIEIYDPVIDYYVGNPIPARLTGDTKARKTFVWEFEIKNRGQGGKMRYTMSYFVDGRPVKISAKPGSYDNTWNGEGSCSVKVK